jgi:hypothetical protein
MNKQYISTTNAVDMRQLLRLPSTEFSRSPAPSACINPARSNRIVEGVDKECMNHDDTIRKKLIKRAANKALKIYKRGLTQFIMTSRFNNNTWSENQQFRQNIKTKDSNKICIYCAPEKVAQYIPVESYMFVLEMNNDTNKIMGVGLVRNHPICNKMNVYKNGNYNRYVYSSNRRIDRTEMTEKEETIMKVFDILCFTGNRHMKRGQGLKAFPIDMIYKCRTIMDLVTFMGDMFKLRSKEGFL